MVGLPQGGGLVDLSLRASNEGFLLPSLRHRAFSPKGVAGLSFTARIGRAPFHRARSASTKGSLVAPASFCARMPRMSAFKLVLWAFLAILGAVALAYVVGVISPNEKVNGLWLVVAAACIYVLAFRFYGRWIARSVTELNDQRVTPAIRLNDGVEYWWSVGEGFA